MIKTHLSVPGDATVFCSDAGKYSPVTNVASLVTCEKCLVTIDMRVAEGSMAIRHITQTVVTKETAGIYISVAEFVLTKDNEQDSTWNREDVEELSEHTSLSKEEVVKMLKASGLKPNPNQRIDRRHDYTYNAGGTFGFGGLR